MLNHRMDSGTADVPTLVSVVVSRPHRHRELPFSLVVVSRPRLVEEAGQVQATVPEQAGAAWREW
jgi:hypothetical protein